MLPYVYRVTKYDPADRNEHGHYTGPEDPVSDHGPVEAAYLAAVGAFAAASGVRELELREPQLPAATVHFGLEPVIDGFGLDGLLPGGAAGLYDGVRVPLAVGQELVRAMLRDHGVWCRLEDGERFFVHIGWDQYLYVGSHLPCEEAVARTAALGLFPERIDASPYHPDYDEPGEQRPADDTFWARLRWCVEQGEAALLEEMYAHNASRWHRLTGGAIDTVRAALAPRALLAGWPEPRTDLAQVTAELAARPADDTVELVLEHPDGRITATVGEAAELAALPPARAAAVLSIYTDERHPLLTAALPDADGVLRARWRTDPTPGDAHWARLRALRVGDPVRATVLDATTAALDGLPGLAALLRGAVAAAPGERIGARVVEVDLIRERLVLSPVGRN
ncbi:RNA-binding protein [Streptomyces sp. TLI_171]|uniref:RNA-binding protein n=1 Tax=Streptomyces sp. TLI_171 TaxID=1938859 RepID=UPI000C1869DD|nr:RNA-binding protein [Streptomyces sp. TLI_171]RKE23340.1 small subunit ribosomal protein S1 [Streptomyces sp. TLI_171]